MTQTQRIYGIFAGIGIVILALIAWYFIDAKKAIAPEPQDQTSTTTQVANTSTTTANSKPSSPTISGVTVDATSPSGTVQPVNIKDLPKAPSLQHEVVFDVSLSPDVKKILQNRIAADVDGLKKIPYSLEYWIDLGINYKQAGDYQAAKDAWTYAGLISPGNTVSFTDLGNLEQYYLHDYVNAEKNFLKVIANDKNYVLGYLNLSDLYRLSYETNTTKSVDVLKQGLTVIPNNIDMTIALAVYYADKKDTTNAKIYYEQAIALANKQGNTTLAHSLTADMNALK